MQPKTTRPPRGQTLNVYVSQACLAKLERLREKWGLAYGRVIEKALEKVK